MMHLNKSKMKRKISIAIMVLPLLIFQSCATGQAVKNGVEKSNANQIINYALLPKLPPPPHPEPFEVTTIPLPENVSSAVLVNYLPDGKHLIAEVTFKGSKKAEIALLKDDGTDFKCLTCGLDEEVGGEMPVPLPDGKTIYTPTGILECSPSILDCKEAKILPLVYPEIPGSKIIWRIASNMSPDGVHVGTTVITTKGALVLVSELTKVSEKGNEHYALTNAKVISGQPAEIVPGSFRYTTKGGGEVKSFIGAGRYLTCISLFEAGNFDLSKIDLETGKVERLTREFSYDEGTYPSPDGKWIMFQTHRQTKRMDAFGLIPRPLIAGLPQSAGIAYQRNAEFEGYATARRFYGLTMVDKYGDRARFPEDGYTGQDITTAKDNYVLYNHFGNFTWAPNSTYGVFWEQKDPKETKPGEQEGRLRMVRFTSRKPTTPLKPYTPKIEWAENLKDLKWPEPAVRRNGELKGFKSGYANISYQKSDSSKELLQVIEYHNFSDDSLYFLNGKESFTLGESFNREVNWKADITVTGQRTGYLKADVIFKTQEKSTGTIQAKLGDYEADVDFAKGLPTGKPDELR